MTQYLDKAAVVAEIKKRFDEYSNSILKHYDAYKEAKAQELGKILTILDTLEVKDPYEQCIQYASVKDGIKAHAETYSFNIESELFTQLTREQQALWRKEIEQACISGGDMGYSLAKDPRYKENFEAKEVDLEKEYKDFVEEDLAYNKLVNDIVGKAIAKHFYELGLKAKGK